MLEVKTPIDGEEIHVREVTKFGNGAKIDFLGKFIGKKVLVVVLKDD
jgi:putative transposon-encoded protein